MRDEASWPAIWVTAMVAAGIVFSLWPVLDFWASAAFYSAEGGFPAARIHILEEVRQGIWTVAMLPVWLALAALFLAAATGQGLATREGVTLWLPVRLWAFVLVLYLLGPGLLVNGILKAHWGRARPDTTELFGSTAHFTPALQPASECARNCSFASGEAAVVAAFGIAAGLALVYHAPGLSRRRLRQGLWLAIGVVLAGSVMRVAMGRHFLSDVIFALLIVAGVAVFLDRIMLRGLVWRERMRGTLAGNRTVAVLTTPATPPIRPSTR